MDINGGQRRSLGPGWCPIFSPDGHNILYKKQFTIEKHKVDLLVSRNLTATAPDSMSAPTTDAINEDNGEYSPDGKHIVCVTKGLTLLSADRSNTTALTTNAFDAQPVFTPDGQTIVFLRGVQHSSMFSDDDCERYDFARIDPAVFCWSDVFVNEKN